MGLHYLSWIQSPRSAGLRSRGHGGSEDSLPADSESKTGDRLAKKERKNDEGFSWKKDAKKRGGNEKRRSSGDSANKR